MTDLPLHIRVGAIEYRVVEWSFSESNKADRYGECDFENRVIRVRETLNDDDKARILLHEVFHAAWDMGGLEEHCAEEKAVTVLANQVTAIWRDNPDFVRFMNAALSIDTG